MKYSENEKQLCELGRKKYEPTLIANGFFSYKDCGHAWFRIQNGFVQNILLANMLPGYGLMVQIYYGVFPKYINLYIMELEDVNIKECNNKQEYYNFQNKSLVSKLLLHLTPFVL